MNKYRILSPMGFHDGKITHARGVETELSPGPQLTAGLQLKLVEPVKPAAPETKAAPAGK